jgi:hypothetical protein
MHCHIAWHASEGLAMQFVERVSEIPGDVGLTTAWTDLCDAWNTYEATMVYTQDDSGI